ncbi:MAG: hypothetical protein ABIR79_10420 [Candidatus Binatia bacterium]
MCRPPTPSSRSCIARARSARRTSRSSSGIFYPLGYLLVFGVGIDHTLDYTAFFLAGVLGMASFGIASNTSRSFFLAHDNGIFYES